MDNLAEGYFLQALKQCDTLCTFAKGFQMFLPFS
jgi:hypothetical protein